MTADSSAGHQMSSASPSPAFRSYPFMRLRKDASIWLTELPEAGTEWAFVSSTVSLLHAFKVSAMETRGLNSRRWKAGRISVPGLHFTGVRTWGLSYLLQACGTQATQLYLPPLHTGAAVQCLWGLGESAGTESRN